MLKSALFTTTAIAAALLTTGCEQKTPVAQEKQDQASELAAEPTPNAAERTAAEAGNEIEQVAAPNAQITPGEIAAGLNGVDVPNPSGTLSTASVKTADGQAIGEVRSVLVGPNGKANAVIVEVGGFLNVGERGVAIDAKKVTYLKERNILVVSLTKSDIEKMPAAPVAQP